MFSTERSDFAVPVIGYFLMAILLVFEFLFFFFLGDVFKTNYLFGNESVVYVLGALLAITGIASLWKAYIVDGATFLLTGAVIFAAAYASSMTQTGNYTLGVALILIGAMAFRAKDILVLANNALAGLGFVFVGIFMSTDGDVNALAIIGGILVLLAAFVSLFICYNDWSLVQDIASDYEEAMLEEECDCDCGCEDGCGCGCHDKE